MSDYLKKIEEIRPRIEKANNAISRYKFMLENAKQEQDALKETALQKFGTNDPAELNLLYHSQEGENQEKWETLLATLSQVEEALKALESSVR